MERLVAIDFSRGIAVLMMIFSHIGLFTNITLKNIKLHRPISMYGMETIFTIVGVIAHTLFIILVGVNLVSSYNKQIYIANRDQEKNTNKHKNRYILRNLKRSAMIMIFGIFMSIITKLVFGNWVIIFGIFQFISISIILAMPFVMWSVGKTGIAFFIVLAITSAFSVFKLDNKCFTYDILGVINAAFGLNKNVYLDHFPLFPYFAYVLAGVILGKAIYQNKSMYSSIAKHNKDPSCSTKFLAKIGKNSIKIYFAHLIIIFFVMRIYLSPSAKSKISIN